MPSVNVKESNDDFELEVAAPGLDRDDFKIEIEHGVLRISSEKEVSNETAEGQHFTQREFSYQSLCRSFTLPESADSDKIEAKYDNGHSQDKHSEERGSQTKATEENQD